MATITFAFINEFTQLCSMCFPSNLFFFWEKKKKKHELSELNCVCYHFRWRTTGNSNCFMGSLQPSSLTMLDFNPPLPGNDTHSNKEENSLM